MIDLASIPQSPGCYLYKDKEGTVIYVGKARDLKKRVSSYFQKKDHDKKTAVLVSKISQVEYFVTDSETEALILENNLIKKHTPQYNIVLKDSRKYAYLRLTHEAYPSLVVARDHTSAGTYFGPFVSAELRDHVKESLIKAYKLKTCKKLPKKACLRYHINLCSAPCIGNISVQDYQQNVAYSQMALQGKTKELTNILTDQMKKYSDHQQFEQALDMREKIVALQRLAEKQKVERDKKYNEDIINYREKNGEVYLLLFNINKGVLQNKQPFIFSAKEGFMEEFLLQYYTENDIPKEIILPRAVGDAVNSALNKIAGKRIRITVPHIGEKKALLDLVDKNIDVQFFFHEQSLGILQECLGLNDTPSVIECFDISHLSGSFTVASMVQFRNGIADTSNYRRFRIKTVDGIDDFSAIAEVVRRRYQRLVNEQKSLPNLIVIDGGRGQLSAALGELQALGIRIPIISLAKRLEEVYVPGREQPLTIPQSSKGLLLLRRIRDEAHRFAISYHKLLRTKQITEGR